MGMTGREKKVIGMTAFGHALCHFYMLILAGALLAIVKDLNSTTARITAYGTICYLIFGLGALPGGLLVSYSNPKRVLQVFFLFSAIASLCTGLSRDRLAFAVSLAVLGSAGSLYHVSGVTLITQVVRKRGKALGLHGVAGSAGITLTPLIAGIVLSFSGWRSIYLLGALFGFIGFLILVADRSIPVRHTETEQRTVAPVRRHMITAFAIMVGVMMINGLVYRGFLTMLPAFVTERLSSSDSPFTGGLVSTLILSVGMIGQYAGGHLSDRISMIHLYLIVLLLSLPFLFLLGLVQREWIVVMGVFFALFHFPQQPIENHLISKWMPPRWVGSGYGVKFTATFGVGAFAAALTGIIADRISIAMVFPILSGGVLFSSLLMLTLITHIRKRNLNMNIH
jgi:MFS family permease